MNKPGTSDQLPVTKLNSKQLRVSEPTEKDLAKIKRREIYIVCDNILDTYNIGSIFRLADAAGVKKIYLCGDCETPPNIKILRAAVGTDKWVEWAYCASAREAINELRRQFPGVIATRQQAEAKQSSQKKIASSSSTPRNDGEGIKVIAVEQDKGSVDYRTIEYSQPLALVVGHETTGVSQETLKACDQSVEIPMYGVNISINVMVSLAIVLYKSIEGIAED